MILVAFVLIILLVAAVFSVDVAYMHMVRAEMRTATDAAARAGSETLARTQDRDQAVAAAIQTAALNRVAGQALSVGESDVQVGGFRTGPGGSLDFVKNQMPFTAVRVLASRDRSSVDGEVDLFFANAFNLKSFAPKETATAASNVRDVALVLDMSGSMNSWTGKGKGTRLKALKDAVKVFVKELRDSSPKAQMSLVTYSSAATKQIDLSSNLGQIISKLNKFKAGGMTAIGDALTAGSDSLLNDSQVRPFSIKTIVLMTDGNHNRGPSPMTTVSTAIARGQQVHTITFSSGANQKLMREVAEATPGGIHLHADNADDLSIVFRDIARTMSVILTE